MGNLSGGGDAGVWNASEMFNSVNNAYVEHSANPVANDAWDKYYDNIFSRSSDTWYDAATEKFIAGNDDNGMKIFNISTASVAGNYNNTYLLKTSNLGFNDPISSVAFCDYRTSYDTDGTILAPSDSTVYTTNLNSSTSIGTKEDEFRNNIVDQLNQQITSFDATWAAIDVSTYVSALQDNDYINDTDTPGHTTGNYSTSLFFTTTKADQDVFFISFRMAAYTQSAGITLKNISTSDGSATQPDVQGYYGPASSNNGGLKGTVFSCHRLGSYSIITTSSGLAYSYIRVNGALGGDVGDTTKGGILVDFIDFSTYSQTTCAVTVDNYSGVLYELSKSGLDTLILTFRRSGNVVTCYNPNNIGTITSNNATNGLISTNSP